VPGRHFPVEDQIADSGLEEQIAEFARGLLARMGFSVTVEAHFSDGAYEVRIGGGENDAILIGRRGETLEALQHVLAKMASRGRDDLVRVRVDVANYRAHRDGELAEQALAWGQQVRDTGRPVVTEPLPAAERRIVHRTLSETMDIKTQALGEGIVKRIWIGPAEAEVPASQHIPAERTEHDMDAPDPGRMRRPAEPVPSRTPSPAADEPASGPEVADWTESWNADPNKTGSPAPEWGRKPKPAKGRRR